MVNHFRTKDIIEKYDISRQTLYNWIQEGILEEPEKDWRGWRKWNLNNIKQLELILKSKENQNIQNKTSEERYFEIYNRRYLGNKQKLIDFIDHIIEQKAYEFTTFFEPFGGTGSVSNYYNNNGKSIIINDILKSNFITYNTFFGDENYDMDKIKELIKMLNGLDSKEENYFSINFGNRYFTLDNARKIGIVRDKIDILFNEAKINEREKCILITSLLFAADKAANTCGHYDAYREKLDSTKEIELMIPDINDSVNSGNKIYNCDANILAKDIVADVTYIDTPYNSRQYGDAYHLLENIANNNKPEVIGKAKKMKDRKDIKSDYCTVKAVDAFADLIGNLNTKHIFVSYNNMAKKGNGRSNAKISNEEIIEILSKKGKVEVFSTDYNAFTTGKSKIDNHKELIYYCKVLKEKDEIPKYIKSPFNYTGGKFKLLEQIIPLFPKGIENFIDLFSGGCNVGINVNSLNKKFIDYNKNLMNMLNVFKDFSRDQILNAIDEVIRKYELSDTSKNGYEYYGCNSSDGLATYNREKYNKLRKDYNDMRGSEDKFKENIYLY